MANEVKRLVFEVLPGSGTGMDGQQVEVPLTHAFRAFVGRTKAAVQTVQLKEPSVSEILGMGINEMT